MSVYSVCLRVRNGLVATIVLDIIFNTQHLKWIDNRVSGVLENCLLPSQCDIYLKINYTSVHTNENMHVRGIVRVLLHYI